jgi:hypothetical protein
MSRGFPRVSNEYPLMIRFLIIIIAISAGVALTGHGVHADKPKPPAKSANGIARL